MKRLAVFLPALLFAAGLIAALLDLGPVAGELGKSVAAHLPLSGVEHPVTAVLLNYRGYDTLLEVAVLLVALLGCLAAGPKSPAAPAADPMLGDFARWLVPAMLPFAVYLLWLGAFRPGGAFQAGAVLAASAILLHLAGRLPGWPLPGPGLRCGFAGGFLFFLGVAAGLWLAGGQLLGYPPAHAGLLILLIESALTVSLGLLLAGLFLTGREAGE
ncbi:Na(+)/H(+) antiporter subunit B [Azonexus sp.]|jgi:multisubunit Na+/H+ antiporter MnhB subunit|uniref:Na(+)/H(+) antiporter subunit B n=1 Tax=Azonexus sp. TaxID=1872668 RepID=UPI0035B005DF